MKILMIGGTGTISMAISRKLIADGHEVYLLNRGTRAEELPQGAILLKGDIRDEEQVQNLLEGLTFDAAAEFVAFREEDVARDWKLLRGKVKQYLFISSASAYQKPLADYRITEGTPLSNPESEYARNKIACEEFLTKKYREEGFPVTIVRPSHTYDERRVPFAIRGSGNGWQVLKRMKEGKPVLIPGDGTSLWTLTHNTDFAEGFAGLIGNVHAIGETVQITSDETLTWNQIYALAADALGVELNALHVPSDFLADCDEGYDFRGGLLGDKAYSVVFVNEKLKRLVPGFAAKKRFDQGVREIVHYMETHPEAQEEDEKFDAFCDRVARAMELARTFVREG